MDSTWKPNKCLPVPGLTLVRNFVSRSEHDALLTFIDSQIWSSSLNRRTQQYGFEYSYVGGLPKATTPLPEEFDVLLDRLAPFFRIKPNQVIVNEYQPGQGIGPHIDNVRDFGDTVASLSLLDTWSMVFKKGAREHDIPLPTRSVIILKGDARYRWRHSIKKKRLQRKRRVSITFRSMIHG